MTAAQVCFSQNGVTSDDSQITAWPSGFTNQRGIGYFLVAGSRHRAAGRTHAQSLCRDSCTCVETQPCQQHAEWQHKTYGERLWSLAHGGRRDGAIQVQHLSPTLETLTLDQA